MTLCVDRGLLPAVSTRDVSSSAASMLRTHRESSATLAPYPSPSPPPPNRLPATVSITAPPPAPAVPPLGVLAAGLEPVSVCVTRSTLGPVLVAAGFEPGSGGRLGALLGLRPCCVRRRMRREWVLVAVAVALWLPWLAWRAAAACTRSGVSLAAGCPRAAKLSRMWMAVLAVLARAGVLVGTVCPSLGLAALLAAAPSVPAPAVLVPVLC
mmetsp:Transcript_4847/g.11888  ORF Transcript_4847/g.11888 Transcript_4847/m.11888 type:complete len:211 (+) Transcript_4847:709-1341(+)